MWGLNMKETLEMVSEQCRMMYKFFGLFSMKMKGAKSKLQAGEIKMALYPEFFVRDTFDFSIKGRFLYIALSFIVFA